MSAIAHAGQRPPAAVRSPLLLVAGFLAPLVFLLVVANLALSSLRVRGGMPLPDYATWSGALEVERKLRLLGDFARNGPVDVLIVSSSLGDHGISAATLNEPKPGRQARPLRAFNFSLGGSDLPTYPMMYRLARLVAKPREVWLVVPLVGPRIEIVPGSLDEQLLRGPLSRYEARGLLGLSHRFHELPMVRFAPALRDAAMNGGFPNRPVTSVDYYHIDSAGDMVSWVYNPQQYEVGTKLAAARRLEASLFVSQPDAAEAKNIRAVYFHERAMAGIRELRDELRADGVRLTIIAFDHAVGLGMRDAEYIEQTRRYFDYLSRELGAPVVDVREDFELMPYMIADASHLNAIGAHAFTEVLADRIGGIAPRRGARHEVASRIRTQAADPGWTPFTALVSKGADEPSRTLELAYLQSWGLGRLRADANVRLRIRLPDDSEVTVPTRAPSEGRVIADLSGVPISGRDVVLRLQLGPGSASTGEPLPLPLASYRWSAESFAPGFFAHPPRGHVASEARVYTTHEGIRVRWSGVAAPESGDWVGVYPVDDEKAARLTYAQLEGAASGRAEMRALFVPGRYELRLFRDDAWDMLAVSEPFDVVPVPAR